jgi:hypothetical protein
MKKKAPSVNPGWGAEPSFFKDDVVTVDFGTNGGIFNAKVIGFHSYGDSHKYDLEVKYIGTVDGLSVKDTARIYNIDGRFLALQES